MPLPAEYHEAFFREIEKLNPEQRKAVDQTEGPVLVVAGPGTGKTHILSARVGRILLDTDTSAQSILCLTYTDAGVQAMRQRLLSLIGPEAHNIHIFTYHSFCNRVIQDNLDLFGMGELESLADLEQVEIIRQLLDELPAGHPLKNGYIYERHLANLFQTMKSEGWTPDFLSQRIDEYLASLPSREKFIYQRNSGPNKKGDLKTVDIEQETLIMERLRSAGYCLDHYQQLLADRRRYDYDDMILWVLEGFRKFPFLLRSYQERYLYFLVDEYQDTNGAQNKLLRQLISYWEDSPNIFIVGDDDQSIYEFQGARLKNLREFVEDYRDQLQWVVLRENYRSSQPILDAAHGLIQANTNRIGRHIQELDLEKILVARHADAPHWKNPPLLLEYPNRLHEETALADELERLGREGFPMEEVAVIYARHKQAARLMNLLDRRNIPYQARRKVNILDLLPVRQFRQALEYLETETRAPFSGEALLFPLLHAPFWGIPSMDLAQVSLKIAHLQAEEEGLVKWRTHLANPVFYEGLALAAPEKIQQAIRLLERWLEAASALPPVRLLERLFSEGDFLQVAWKDADPVWQVQVWFSLMQFVQAETLRKPRLDLTTLLQTWRSMDDNNLAIELQQSIVSRKGVQLITAHSAKGLEFRRVYLLDCTEEYWAPGGRQGNNRFKLPDTLVFSGEEDPLEARRRLFYVAITRAKEQLVCSYALANDANKPLTRTRFLNELGQTHAEQREASPASVLTTQKLLLLEQRAPRLDRLDSALAASLLEGFRLSASAMAQFEKCRLGFFFEYVLRMPRQPHEASLYGDAAHQALKRLYENRNGKTYLLDEFRREMQKRQGLFSPTGFNQYLEKGLHHLDLFYEKDARHWRHSGQAELGIYHAEIAGAPVKGKIDRVDDLDQGQVEIIDYKTGKSQQDSYIRQMQFYQLLLEAHRPGAYRVVGGRLVFLDPSVSDKTVSLSDADRETLRQRIREVYDRIQEQDFYEGCGKCDWCRFARENLPLADLSNPETESLDDNA